MPQEIKADVTLHDGKEITFDFHKITFKEWRTLFDNDVKQEAKDEKVAKVCGLSVDEFGEISYADHFVLMNKFWERSQDPLTDPKNSPSVPS